MYYTIAYIQEWGGFACNNNIIMECIYYGRYYRDCPSNMQQCKSLYIGIMCVCVYVVRRAN